jgi:hypothetical protein
MRGRLSSHFDLRHISPFGREPNVRGLGAREEAPHWSPPRASVVIIGSIAIALLVWLAYALGWLP